MEKQIDIILRIENKADYQYVFDLIEKAFRNVKFSDHREQFFVERLRNSDAFIPELSIVAETKNNIVGHILLTKLKIVNNTNEFESLSLAPVSVLPDYQGKGIGGLLIKHAHAKAKELGYKSIVLVGHKKYYPGFGYQVAGNFGIAFPFDVPTENCMVMELIENGLKNVHGIVEYPHEFYE
jgi:predicted N-acetyltransferase YhbS